MAAEFWIKKDDRYPALMARLRTGDGDPINLSAALSVLFRMQPVGGGALKVSAAAIITDAANGLVTYSWAAGDTDTLGDFNSEFVLTFPGGNMTHPPSGFALIHVMSSLV